MIRQFLRKLRRNQRGATLIEFALVAPVLMVVIMGLLDMSYRLYAKAMLEGTVQKAARDSTLQTGATATANAAIDDSVKAAFKQVNGRVTDSNFTFTRRNFANFTSAGKMEPSTGPGGQCAAGYTYVDVNNSGSWDDGALAGQGGANDATLYTVQVSYTSLFPVNALFGASSTQVIKASTVLRNQPYNVQASRTAGPTRNC
jgi:Flp pilus assembly protein TadG